MPPFPNLVSDSILINETIRLLSRNGGNATATQIVDRVMRIRKPDPHLAQMLAADLVERDSRLMMIGDKVSLAGQDVDALSLKTATFVVLDLETTGAKAPPCRITEIGAYTVKNKELAGEFHSLIDPEVPIPEFITALTGISNEMVRGAPRFREVVNSLLDFIGDSIIVAHNSHFDLGFLNHEIGKVFEDYRLGNPSLCTVKLSRRLLPNIANHKLNTVAGHYHIDLINHHRAVDDARATAHIFVNFLTEMEALGISHLADVIKFTRQKPKPKVRSK
ncbi:MAG TPA: exonuclease domain-containing protein [Pyrinomonadaceae bacterium]|nr:exonuclease domain-containing protein [Pyrinomonadaceae bacterium]HMP64242.1 exonuclease domain-containing protein [Pyrinomonadaceae bacterium]